jgi:hypothetical protein
MILAEANFVERAYPMQTYLQPLESTFPSGKDVLVHKKVVLSLICTSHVEHDVDELHKKA